MCFLFGIFYLLWNYFQCIDVILDKFKEKKPAVVVALKAAIDAIFLTVID